MAATQIRGSTQIINGTVADAQIAAAAAIQISKLAALAANTVVANATGGSATPTAVAMTNAATASAVAIRDANANVQANNFISNAATTATAAGTTTLSNTSAEIQQFTGSTTQTVVLPNATTLAVGQQFFITNRSTGAVTVNMNGGALLQTMAPSSYAIFTLINNGTAAGTWDSAYAAGGGSGTVTTVSVTSANGFSGTVANAGTTPAITMQTSVSGMLKGSANALVAAVAGTDYMAPADFVTRETPTGTINGVNTTFTLANTPISGTEQVFLNGLLQEPGGNDYTISGVTITMATAPATGDRLRVNYMK
jgi:hypothetical protein